MTVAPWPPVDRSTCEHCGAHVTDRFRRVFGNDEDRAHRCGDHNCISGSSKAKVLYGIMRDADLGANLKKMGSPTSAHRSTPRE